MKTLIRTAIVVLGFTVMVSTASWAADAGADVYRTKCASCHGQTGAGDTTIGKNMKVKDLSSAEVQKQSDADMTTIITKGKKPMPGYEGKLTNEQIQDLVVFVRSLKK